MDKSPLDLLARQCLVVLGKQLPGLSPDWWTTHVVKQLTFQQQQYLQQGQVSRLDQLDLAALLRLVDQNWYELSNINSWPIAARNWLKESQTIRNRWAHAPAGGLADSDIYRDLDTLERLTALLGADDAELVAIRNRRKLLIAKLAGVGNAQVTVAAATPPSTFAKGALVRLKSKPTVTGAVIDHLPGEPEDRFLVFHDGAVATYYASQLEAAAAKSARMEVSPDALHAALTALQLRHPSTSHLYSLFASRINFVPYQFRPVLKLIQSDRPRLLIADEVGVGKTIEAGLILKELQARRELRSVLVICPKPLVAERKWLEEMKRFDEQFTQLDGPALRYCIDETHLDGVWPQQHARAILPYSLFDETLLMGKQQGKRKQRGLLDLDPPPAFDLVIVDEAHHIRNTDTWAYRTVRYFCDNAEAVVLLTATPIQLGDNDLFTLLHLLRPDVLPSRQAFEQMSEPNPYINAAIESARATRADWQAATRNAIVQAVATAWGQGVMTADPRLQQVHDLLDADFTDAEARLTLIRQLENLYTFAPLINRTRRRDIGSFTLRKPETIAVDFTPEQATLHHDLLDLIGRILTHRHGDMNLQFMLTTVRRQLASCVFGLAPLLDTVLHRHLSRIEISEVGDDETPDELDDVLAEFRGDVEQLILQARNLKGPDPKFEAFRKTIRNKQKLPNNKLLVFSTFRHTLAYLMKQLTGESIRVGLIHGDVPDDERRELRHRFSLAKEDPQALDVLLSSEVGCEGLDFQFCDGLVNYDLPWNPMRVEQRIGRIDRYGQKSETVAIYNFITPGTVDAEIYERCLLRIGVFRQALGGSEEILGQITREIRDIAENLSLSPEEQASRLQQLADNQIRAIQEQAKLEDEQATLFGLNLPRQDEDMVREASSFWLSQAMLANLVERYLTQLEPGKVSRPLASKPVVTLQLAQDVRDKLLTDFKPLKLTGATARTWERWLKGNDAYLTLTFDAATAADRRDIAFINPTHPLARQAAHAVDPATPPVCILGAETNMVAPGRYPYAIYRWQKLGLKEDFTFQPVCTDSALVDHLLTLLASAQAGATDLPLAVDEEEALEQAHYRLWSDARAEHIEQVQQHACTRQASLDTTHAARLAILEEQRDANADSRIRRMRESQIEAARRDYERRTEKLKIAPGQADVIAEAVAFGILAVTRASKI
ncbi:MAG: SNF2-related protein [Sulfuritalea sp.]|nr:SNF2-related protein [Sulfuritalea sp.]